MLAARRRPYHNIADFPRLGLDPAALRLLVVKSGYLSPELAPIANPNLMALTDGVVNQDIASLPNRHRRPGTLPFDAEPGLPPPGRRSPPASPADAPPTGSLSSRIEPDVPASCPASAAIAAPP